MSERNNNTWSNILDDLNAQLAKKPIISIALVLITTLVFSLLFFNVGVNIGGDDSGYVLRAMRLIQKGDWPSFQGAIYPIFLAPFYALFNGNVIALKALSILLFLGSQYFIFRIFKATFQPLLLLLLLLTLSINYYWITYASLSYSEALFNLLQFGTIYFFYQNFIRKEATLTHIIILAVLGLLMLKTRVTGAGLFVSVAVFFALHKQWKPLLYFSVASLVLVSGWDIVTHFFLGGRQTIFVSQLAGLLQKNPYDVSQGSVGLKLFFERLWYNFNLYISKHGLQMLGFRSRGFIEAKWILTALVSFFAIAALIFNPKKDKLILFTLIYLGIGFMVVFVTPKMWDQARFIQPLIPFIFIWIAYEFQSMAKKYGKSIPYLMVSILFIVQNIHAIPFAKENVVRIKAYSYGDKYFENTPDWQNYFKACEWVVENADKDSEIACRKPQIAAVITRKDNFYGIYKLPAYNCAEIKDKLQNPDKHLLIIDVEKLFSYQVPEPIEQALKSDLAGVILKESVPGNWRLFDIQHPRVYQEILNANQQLKVLMPMDDLIKPNNNYSITYADSLVKRLKNSNVNYIVKAQLRVYKTQRTEDILSSVHTYMSVVEMKYPNMFRKVFEVGLETLEPAEVYKINYDGGASKAGGTVLANEKTALENYQKMCEWALQNTKKGGGLLCSNLDINVDAQNMNRLVSTNSVPAMNYAQFMKFYRANKASYLIIDPADLDAKKAAPELWAALYQGYHGYVNIGEYMLRLHYISSPKVLQDIKNDSYISKFVFKDEYLEGLSAEQKKFFRVVEPSFMLQQLKQKNIQYIIEDSMEKEISKNIPKKLIFLIKRKHPNAFFKVKELGSTDANTVSLYRVNYNVLD